MARNSPEDEFSVNVFPVPPYTNSQPEAWSSTRNKAGPTLLFSGIFIGMVGITLTLFGWIRSDGTRGFRWTHLLGPIMIIVSLTFILISACKFKMLSCKRRNNTATEPEPSTAGQSFVFNGINQPITFHGATVVQYIPPPYTVYDPIESSPSASTLSPSNSSAGMVNRVAPPILPPQYSSIYPLENPAFVEDEEALPPPAHERSPVSSQHHEIHSELPPLYDDLYPGLNSVVHNASPSS
ncbi:transmembrane protein 174 [Bufo bufo]|uniref:transmembrane protein 174 n=1 Tax=Bufo bufo TaxID=8384 RepID=UPI001ABE021F|nr:transmembrane protein 174 [Bufo bufo]